VTATPSPTAQPSGASRRSGALLLADISGYTGFLQGVADAHRDLIVDAATSALAVATNAMAAAEESPDGSPPVSVHILVLDGSGAGARA
jgi:hypothetical protein